MSRPTKIQIDLNALIHNQSVVRKYAPNSQMVCCVKANAYGHGLVDVASELAEKSDALAVASLDEGRQLREAGIKGPILLLEGIFEPSELVEVEELSLWLVVHNKLQLNWLCESEPIASTKLWIKADTGMHRLGFSQVAAVEAYMSLKKTGWQDMVLMTHFACAEELHSEFTHKQIKDFAEVGKQVHASKSLANSAAIIGWPQTHKDWVRPGFMLYGLSPFGEDHPSARELEPVMTFASEVIAIRDLPRGESVGYNRCWVADRPSRIATVAAGYGDGYPRNVANGAPILVGGQRARIAGRVSMDMLSVDVTGLHNIEIGTSVELWGKQLSVNEVAAFSGYSAYELLTRMPLRAKRIYLT
tara:strand:- start:89 stop:1165 length:1077 start_codon:yes stop_codon:yes gene_type:complete